LLAANGKRWGKLRLTREAVGGPKLDHMVRICRTGRLRKDRQYPCHGTMMMSGTIAFVMQHQAHPIRTRLKLDVMVGIKLSNKCRHRKPER